MTREEAIKKMESLKISLPAAKDEISEIINLIKTPWISVKDDLPCNHEELMTVDDKGRHETKRVIIRYLDKELSGATTVHIADCMMSKWDCEEDKFLCHLYSQGIVTHWMPIPELPK